MASSVSPIQQDHGVGSDDGTERDGLSSLNLGFLRNLSEKRAVKDGNPPKRRGPKPDSRPALTRRQELNRQAQRTHRERKELYIKALEDEVLRLKEVYSNISQDKDRLAEENRQLKQLLTQSGVNPLTVQAIGSGFIDDSASNPSAGYSGSVSGVSYIPASSSHTSAFTPPPPSTTMTGQQGVSPPQQADGLPRDPSSRQTQDQPSTLDLQHSTGIDYDQAGIDFVLTLEKPCMAHLPFLLESGAHSGTEPCGHALMASCPSVPFSGLTENAAFGYSNISHPDRELGQKTWEIPKGNLATLLKLSSNLKLDGEITPVMAWGMVLAHPRLRDLTSFDFQRLTEELSRKVRCYGFGAVMEEFEVRDALENVLSTEPERIVATNTGIAIAY